jgi:hypothetical protein
MCSAWDYVSKKLKYSMKALIIALLTSVGTAHATVLVLTTAWQPLYLHGSDMSVQIQITQVPIVTGSASPEAEFAAISHPFIPPADGSWKRQHDVNLASRYGIAVSVEVVSAYKWLITVDASHAKAPEGYPFTVDQVTDAVVTCVKMMKPMQPESERKLTIRVLKPS